MSVSRGKSKKTAFIKEIDRQGNIHEIISEHELRVGGFYRRFDGCSYLEAGANVAVDSSSGGPIVISSTGGGGGGTGGNDTAAQYITLSSTGSLSAERSLTAGVGVDIVDAGANSTVSPVIDDSETATVSGTIFLGAVSASAGLSGSLQEIAPGLPFLVGGDNVDIVTHSNGQIEISATAAESIATDYWEDVYEIDFTTQPSLSVTASTFIMDGVIWYADNTGNASSIGISSSVGFIIDPNANSSDYFTGVRTAPAVWTRVKNIIPDYDPSQDEIRVWANLEVTGSDQNFELALVGITRLPWPGGSQQMTIHIVKGYAGGSTTQIRTFDGANSFTYTLAQSSSVGVLELRNNRSLWSGYGGDYNYATGEWPNTGSLRWSGNYHDATGNAFFNRFQYDTEVAVEFAAYPVNTANAFSATWRRFKLQRKR